MIYIIPFVWLLFFDSIIVFLSVLPPHSVSISIIVFCFFNIILSLILLGIQEYRNMAKNIIDIFKAIISANVLIAIIFYFFVKITPFIEEIKKVEKVREGLDIVYIVNGKYEFYRNPKKKLIGGYKINEHVIESSLRFVEDL